MGAAGCETKMCHNFGGTHLADIFPTRAEIVSQKFPDLPSRAQTKKYYGSRMCQECVTNVSQMCHKKVWPKSTFWEVTYLGMEPADLVNEHVLRKVKGSFRNTLDEEVT